MSQSFEVRAKGSRGFILAMLLAIIVAMGILLTAAQPSVSTEVQRDQEAELIFRGEAIAAAIRTYRARTGGYPLKLDDLVKVRPPVLRKVYTDPMTPSGEWEFITAVDPGVSGDTTGLPIVGVRSKCQKDSFKVYQGKTLVSDWTFSAAGNLLGTPGAAGAAAAATALSGTNPPATPGGDAQSVPQTTPSGQDASTKKP
jgi:type II secretory pathway pseudopilin PulG